MRTKIHRRQLVRRPVLLTVRCDYDGAHASHVAVKHAQYVWCKGSAS